MTHTTDSIPENAVETNDRGERRKRLREFQSGLAERVQAARTNTDAAANQLGVMIGQTHWLIDLQEVGEIVSVGSIAKVPLTRDWYLGLANIRGNLVSVIDFACFDGFPPIDISLESRIVTFSSRLSFNCGLLVSRVLGLRNMSAMKQHVPDPDSAETSIQQYLDQESVSWSRLQLSLLVQDPRFLHIGL
jgi:twitching motility protein PilI